MAKPELASFTHPGMCEDMFDRIRTIEHKCEVHVSYVEIYGQHEKLPGVQCTLPETLVPDVLGFHQGFRWRSSLSSTPLRGVLLHKEQCQHLSAHDSAPVHVPRTRRFISAV